MECESFQKPVAEFCPEPIKSTPHAHTFFKIRFNIMLLPVAYLPSGLFPSSLSMKIFYRFLIFPCVSHAPAISFFLILSPCQYFL